MSKFRKKLLLITLISNLALFFAAVVYSYFTFKYMELGKELIPCHIKHNLGFYCPGCGGSRSVMALLSLDVVGSFIYYPAVPYTVGVIGFCDVLAVKSFIDDSPSPLFHITEKPFLVIPIIIILNFLIRNVLLLFGIDYIGDILI